MSHVIPPASSSASMRAQAERASEHNGASLVLPGVVVAIPCFNEEVAIGSVVLNARRFAEQVVVVDDGSSDASAAIAELAGARVIRHPRNQGYGGALKTIFSTARQEGWKALVILDSDGQHNPADIPAVVAPLLASECDIAIGSRFVEGSGQENIPAYRKMGIRVLTALNNVGADEAQKVRDAQSGFRAYSRRAVGLIEVRDSDMGISAEILFQARKHGCTIREVPIKVRYDVDGSSQHPVKHGLGVIASMIRYVQIEHPLLFFGLPGFLLLLAGLATGGYALSAYFQSHYLPFGPTVGAAMLIITGLLGAITGLILHAVIQVVSPKGR